MNIAFDNSYAELGPHFSEFTDPTPVSQPSIIAINDSLANQLGLDAQWLRSEPGVQLLAGNHIDSNAKPLAMAYAGHQFGHWVPQLGDGRAILLGEIVDKSGNRFDVQLKGAGRTPFSRGGDGRNWIGPVLREFLISEAMHTLNVPTTRALAAVATGDHVYREQGPLPGAILTRVARGHIRVGTFQYFAARRNNEAIAQLVDYAIDRFYPEVKDSDNPAIALLNAVIGAQAKLVAQWQSLGFIHGVMNTDNCSISGETIDYGPCAFMDTYSADKVFSSIDRGGRYAYQNQPKIAQWNLVNLAQCLLPMIDEQQERAVEIAQEAINNFDAHFITMYLAHMRPKVGLLDEQEEDLELINQLLNQFEEHQIDFTQGFRQLAYRRNDDIYAHGGKLHDWHLAWSQRISNTDTQANIELMQASNPAIIPRNHQVEAIIQAAVEKNDFQPFYQLNDALKDPLNPKHDDGPYAAPPLTHEVVTQTFCGT